MDDSILSDNNIEHGTEVRRHTCVVCFRSYNSKIYLRDHMTIHSDVRAYECKVCSKRFRFGSNLSEHRTVHMTDNLFYKCTECDYSVRLRGNLKKHMRTHFRDRLSLDGAWKEFAMNTPSMADILEQSKSKSQFRIFVGDVQQQAMLKSQPFEMHEDLKTTLSRANDFLQNGVDHAVANFGDTKRLGVQSRFKPASMTRNCVNELVSAFVKKTKDCASLADSVDSFLSALEDLDIDLIDCPFCGKRFYSFFDCTAHISTGDATHQRPIDEQGRSLFCDKCLRCFESVDTLERHKYYHAMMHEMTCSGYVNMTGRLQAFVEEQSTKVTALLSKPNADGGGDKDHDEENLKCSSKLF